MTRAQIAITGTQYQERFANADEIGHPSILFDPRFGALMARALATGVGLTRPDVEAVFPDVAGWDELEFGLPDQPAAA